MTDQLTSLAARLCEAESPYNFHDWEKQDGYYVATCRISKDDVPHLIQLAAKWNDLDWSEDDLGAEVDWEDVEMLPVAAWRSLADLKADEAVEPLIDILGELHNENDDWTSSELPHVFGKIGARAIAALVRLANDIDKPVFIREIAAQALYRVAEYHPETRDEIVAHLTKMMANAREDDIDFNSSVLVGLVEVHASEAAEVIERAFATNRLDVGMLGDWEDTRRKLGVEGMGLEMPKHPHNSVEQFRRRMGIGIFTDRPIFDQDGELTDVADDYFEQAWNVFSKSMEAEQVVERFGNLGWYRSLLDFAIQYRGEIVDEMTVASVQEFVLDYVPRKVSTEPDQAASIVLELTKFWEYVDRVFELPDAKPIIEWLKGDGLVAELEAELSNPENFGMAKSLVMAGKAANYDMTSKAGIAEFVAAYNQSLVQSRRASPPKSTATATSGTKRQRVGRNELCPCGSGKKYKKCCLKR